MSEACLRVEVAYALPERCWRWPLSVAAGACVGDALALVRDLAAAEGIAIDPARLAVFGKAATPETPLHDGDRVEILRPLLADPMQARRRRARDQARR